MTRSLLAGLIVALYEIPHVHEDSWHVTYPPDIRAIKSSTERTGVSYTNSPCDQNQTSTTYCSHLQSLCVMDHAGSSNVPCRTATWRAYYNPHLQKRR
ncbi:hypothetical protein TNCV_986101 [Trichonephila clavipes]|uniref:Secreted protein n=1 Tax=Trichonephila clavipes TaxID=2585209 RepID=A0A8X6VMN1_TRICX|nr:hypothetical protein TNCV_986101 [Trichonephila clavipes]